MKKYKLKTFILSLVIAFILYTSIASASTPIFDNSTIMMLASTGEAQMLSSIIVSQNGYVLVVDGGWTYDANKLITVLNQYGGKVDAWLLTHPDPDHTGALYQILKNQTNLKIDTIYCSFANNEWYYENSPDIAYFVSELKSSLLTQNIVQVSKGDSFFVGDIQFLVLNNRFDYLLNPTNNSSIVYKVTIDNNSILYLGDLGYEGGEKLLAETPPFVLKSDIVQMAHHGQSGVGKEVYRAINPRIALWSTPEWLWTNCSGSGEYKTLETRQWMEQLGCKNYVTANGDIILNTRRINND